VSEEAINPGVISEMKKVTIMAALAFALAPIAAFAATAPAKQAAKDCASLRAKMGATAFAQAFGTAGASNAFGKCVSKFTQVEQANLTSANKLCSAEQVDPTFAATHGGKTFVQFYGTGTGKNAFGKCVSLKAQSSSKVEQSGMNPARTCSSVRTTMGAMFVPSFGTNASHRNAFGKCVSLVARFQSTSVIGAASACLSEVNDATFPATHDGKTFAQFYGTNTDLSNAFGNCVATKLGLATNKLKASLVSASKTCRTMRRSDPTGFRAKYGTRPNAFAKCVVAHTHSQ
jgi:hypothetical protein